MIFNVTCSTDDNYIQHCLAMLCSLYENNKNSKIHVHLLHHGLSDASVKFVEQLTGRYSNEVTFYSIDNDILKNVNRRTNSPVSIATYYRVLLPSLLDNAIEHVLYLDCDIIILRDISSLFELELKDMGIAAIQDCSPFDNRHREIMGMEFGDHAFCAGIMVINLNYWREHNCQQKLLDYSNKKQTYVYLEDQDALNNVFYRHWFKLPNQYGKTPLSFVMIEKDQLISDEYEYAFNPYIIHYSAHIKPWLDVWFPERKFYWKYVKLSGYTHPVITHVPVKLKFKIYRTVFRFLISKYIRPFIPNILETLLYDVCMFFCLLKSIFNLKRFRIFLLRSILHKYGIY